MKNANLYKCKACGAGGSADLEADVRRYKIDPERPNYREARCKDCAPDSVQGVRRRAVDGVREHTSTDHLAEAWRSVTADEMNTLQKSAAGRIAREGYGSNVREDVFDAMLDTFVQYLADRPKTGKSREDCLFAATRSNSNALKGALPTDAEREGTRTLALTLEGFGDGFRADILAEMTPDLAEILSMWQDMAGTVEPTTADPTAWLAGTMADAYGPVTDRVREAATEYLQIRALVDAVAA